MVLANGIIPPAGHAGICFDNAMAESFNAPSIRSLSICTLADSEQGEEEDLPLH
jgi:hypothetical protein